MIILFTLDHEQSIPKTSLKSTLYQKDSILALILFSSFFWHTGDAHLIRIKKCPLRCMLLPADYGLSTLCTGNVKICYVNGDHESIFHDPYVQSLASIIHAILGKK